MRRKAKNTRRTVVFCLCVLSFGPVHAAPPPAVSTVPLLVPQVLDSLPAPDGKTLRLTLPDGRAVVGSIHSLSRAAGHITALSGTVQHPENGDFSFACTVADDGTLTPTGTLRFASQPIEWSLEPASQSGSFQFVKKPAADAFRPRTQVMPATPSGTTPAQAREAAEAALRKGLNIEQISPDRMRVGLVEIDRAARAARIPCVVNLREGTVEYAVVTDTGKKHEAVFTTAASPRDIHLALLLLGSKPAPLAADGAADLTVPAAAAVWLQIEWQAGGVAHMQPLARCCTIARKPGREAAPLAAGPWHYNGSRFNAAGFAALTEGSIVSLIRDDLALANNPSSDRSDDDIHLPNTDILPPLNTPVTLIISLVAPSHSKP